MRGKVGRPRDPEAGYRVRLHTVGKYRYASTRRLVSDPETETEHRQIVHWGTVDENMRFHPNARFMYLSPAERAKMIWPDDWDISGIAELPSERGAGRPACKEDASRFYGDIWLLEQLAEKNGVIRDLRIAFDGCEEMIQDILSLAMFSYLSKLPYSHMKAWQKLGRFPAAHTLDPSVITHLCQAISEENRQAFFRQRTKRTRRNELCAVDSTTRRAYGTHLAEIRYGKNKDDGLKVPQVVEVVVYTLSRHEPIWYMSFQGNMSDKRTLPLILKSLRQAGFKDLVVITDRGYDSQRNLDYCILHGQRFVGAVPVRKKDILRKIEELGSWETAPTGMEWLSDQKVFAKQFDVEKKLKGRGGRIVTSDRLRLNLYFDPKRRSDELIVLQDQLASQKSELEELKAAGTAVDPEKLKNFKFFKVIRDNKTQAIQSYEQNERKIHLVARAFGFFAITTQGLSYTAEQTLAAYSLRDEQEKYFMQLKTQQEADLLRCSSDRSRDGRRFIEFIGMILLSHLSYGWRSSERLHQDFPYVFAMIEEMRCIKCIEHKGKEKIITPFVTKQVTICECFGLEIPKGCEPQYESPVVKSGRKRGRPRKNKLNGTA